MLSALPNEAKAAELEMEDRLDEHSAAEEATQQRDPFVGVMLTVAVSLIVVLLATGGLVFFYLSTLNDAPRTRTERDLAAWESSVKERPDDVNAWAGLAYAHSEAGDHESALEVVARAKRVTGAKELVIVEADVLRSAGRHTEALKAYDDAEAAVKKLLARTEAERKKVGVRVKTGDEALARVYYGRALSRRELGELKGAIADLEKAVERQPEAATFWAVLGDLYAGSEETSRAENAYRQALTYVPDEPTALAGLERLEGK